MKLEQSSSLKRRLLLQGLAASLAAPACFPPPAAAADGPVDNRKVWRLAVVPQLTPVEMTRNWSPIVQALAQAGFPCELVVHSSIANFEPEFLQGRADVVFLNPYHMVMARRAQRYEPLLHDERALEGVLVVKTTSQVENIQQLKGQRISFPAPNAFAASLYIRAVLERQYHLHYLPHYAMNHRNAIRQVLTDDSAAAGIVRTTLENELPEIQRALRVIYTTPRLAPHPIAVHPRLPQALRRKLTETLLELGRDPERQALMAAIQMPNPVRADYEREYAPLQRLQIEKYISS